MKKALLLCASHNDLGLIRALRELGYYIIVTGSIENQPGQKLCDKYIEADYSNKELILNIAKQERIDAIIQCCNDFGVYTAAYVAEELGLPGYDSYETTLLLHNKDKFKQFSKEHKLLSPIAQSFSNIDDALAYVKKAKYPIIIKPTDLSAGNGISKAENLQDAEDSVKIAFEKSRNKRIVIEPFIKGTQHGFCTFLKNKKVVAICSNNEYSFINQYRVEIDTFPADNYEEVKDVLIQQIEYIAKTLKLCDGIFHLQYIYDGKQPQILEVMRRILGNMYHIPGNMQTGIDWEYWETKVRCGLSIEDFPQAIEPFGFFAYKSLMATSNGKIENISIPKKYESYLVSKYLLMEKGDIIEDYKKQVAGFLFMQFPNVELMNDVLISGYDNTLIKVAT